MFLSQHTIQPEFHHNMDKWDINRQMCQRRIGTGDWKDHIKSYRRRLQHATYPAHRRIMGGATAATHPLIVYKNIPAHPSPQFEKQVCW